MPFSVLKYLFLVPEIFKFKKIVKYAYNKNLQYHNDKPTSGARSLEDLVSVT